ncbi:NADPH-dependent FMN reductase [Glaciecola sp. 1036]|uniref:NADPH-dependent FMN reductase n=1 Tax=Alteromonadaceae TaxID=72275 RepID=UPI003CFF68C8
MPKILAFAGSGRRQSYNYSVVKCAAQGAKEAGADVTLIHLADYADVPVFTEDLEAASGMPAKAKEFKQLMLDSDGFLIANPEYNSGYSALFKNLIDWASRKEEGETPLQAFMGKPVALMAASPGGLGGIRVLVPVRLLLSNIGMNVLGNQLSIANVSGLLDEQHEISDQATVQKLHKLAADLVAQF